MKVGKARKLMVVLGMSLGVIIFAGCGKSQKSATIDVKYTSGGGAKSGAFDKSSKLELSNPSFDGQRVVFTYKNLYKDQNGVVFGVVVRTYNQKGIEVDKVTKDLIPGEVSIPCDGKVIDVSTNAKGQAISRVEIEHVGGHSSARFQRQLDNMLGN